MKLVNYLKLSTDFIKLSPYTQLWASLKISISCSFSILLNQKQRRLFQEALKFGNTSDLCEKSFSYSSASFENNPVTKSVVMAHGISNERYGRYLSEND